MAEETANTQPAEKPAESKKKNSNVIVRVIIVLVIAAVAAGGYTLIKDATFSGSNIAVDDLVDETYESIALKRPTGWERVVVEDDGVDIAFSEGGKTLDETDQGIILALEPLGIDYNTLTDAQKELFNSQFESQFSNPTQLQNETCITVENVKAEVVQRDGYDAAYAVEGRCTELKDRPAATATIKMVIGVDNEDLHIMAVVALDETWEKSSEAMAAIMNSLKPAN